MILPMKTLPRLALAALPLLALPGVPPLPARADAPPPPGTHTRTIAMGRWQRPYLLHVPEGRPARGRLPLVVALHGGLNDAAYLTRQSRLNDQADRHGFAVAYPNGLLGTWNAGGCCSVARVAGVDDVGYLDRLLDTLVREGLADPRRVYLAGFSNGGGMAYRYACERPGRVAAVGVVSGSLASLCHPRERVSVLAFHGTADFSVPYHGGGNLDFDVKVPFLPVRWVMDIWRRLNGLPALSRPYLDRGHTRCRTTGRGPDGTEVALCTVDGGGHEWPTATGRAGVDGSAVLWRFFRAHPRPGGPA
ncbi:PHB depolymerase family esterase [Actinomadura kijaniata]